MVTTTKIERGAVEIPAEVREQFGLVEGSELVIESDERGIHLRPAYPDVEIYTPSGWLASDVRSEARIPH